MGESSHRLLVRGRLLLALLLLSTGLCWAHPMDEWFLNLSVQGGKVEGLLRVPADQVPKFEKTPLLFYSGDKPLLFGVEKTEPGSDGRVKMTLEAHTEGSLQALRVKVPEGLLDSNQSVVGFLTVGSSEPVTIMVGPGKEAVFSTEATVDKPDSVYGFFKLGMSHIAEGYDHLLFLFCLLIAGGTFRHFLVVTTSFTVGHSITLAASVLGIISLPSQITETMIALSIVVAALLNVAQLKKNPDGEAQERSVKSRGLLAGSFGLVHGLGFAGILKEIGVRGSGVAAPLLGFNCGVEAGQLTIVTLFLPILIAVNRSSKRVQILTVCSYLAAAIGSYWVIQRMFGG